MKKNKKSEQCSQTPKDIRVNTLVNPSDMEPVPARKEGEPVSQREIDDATAIINPDPNSMESRG